MTRTRIAQFTILGVCLLMGAEPAAGSTTEALREVILADADHYQSWLDDQGDSKSMARVLNNINLLVDILAARGDSADWQKAIAPLRQAAKSVDDTAKKGVKTIEQKEAVKGQLKILRDRVTALGDTAPTGAKVKLRAPGGGIKNFMYYMDSTLADARKAVDDGDFRLARYNADVLGDLGVMVQGIKTGDKWNKLATQFIDTTHEVAHFDSMNTNEFRQKMIDIRVQCEECHENHMK